MIYLDGITLEKALSNQIKCLNLKSKVMRSIYITLLSLIVSISVISQTSYDTTYSKEWNSDSESWTYFDRSITSFENDLLSLELIQVYENEAWENYSMISYHHNNGKVLTELEKTWNDHDQVWINSYRKLYSYNQGHLSQILHQYIFNDVYVNSQREIFKYSNDGQLEAKTVQRFEEAWTNFLRYQYFYNANDLIFEESLTYWDKNKWGDAGFSVNYTYDDDQHVVKKVKTKRNGEKGKNLIREEFIYSDNGRINSHLLSQWNSLGNKWVNKNRAEYVNNMDGYIVSMLNQNKSRKEWINYLYTDFTGSNEPITGMDIADGMTFSIYPVNFGKKAMIEFDNPYRETYFVKVIDTEGRLIGSATTDKNEVSIDARNLSKGLYFIELQGRNIFSGKFSIE